MNSVFTKTLNRWQAAGTDATFRDNVRLVWEHDGGLWLALFGLYVGLSTALIALSGLWVNPDGLSYMSIARQMAEGSFPVRGYWSPLVSWLAAPLIRLGSEPLLAVRLVIAASGLLFCLCTVLVAARLGVERGWLALIGLCAVLISNGVLWLITADLIGAAALFAYLYFLLDPSLLARPVRNGARLGALVGVAYLARSYNLPFIAAHLTFHLLYLWWRARPTLPTMVRFALVLGVVSAVIVGAWALALRGRYGYFTLSTSAQHTRGLVAPGANDVYSITCLNGFALCPQPSDVLFAWEDHLPQLQPGYDWSPFTSAANLQHQFDLIGRNIVYFVVLTMPLALLVAAAFILALLRARGSIRRAVWWSLLTAALYTGGYIITLATGGLRYYLPTIALCSIAFALAIQEAGRTTPGARSAFSRRLITVIGAVALLLSAVNWFWPEGTRIVNWLREGRDPYTILTCRTLDVDPFVPHVAAPFVVVHGDYYLDFYLAYNAQLRSLGTLRPDLYDAEAVAAQLATNAVHTAIAPLDAPVTQALVVEYDYMPVARAAFCGVEYQILRVGGR